MDVPALLLEVGGSHGVEVAETLIAMAEFLVIFVAARAMAELMVRIQLPTILGELVAGVLIDCRKVAGCGGDSYRTLSSSSIYIVIM